MALDDFATIAIIGGGPIGLEAALYARFLGFRIELFERGQIAENVRRQAGQLLPSPFCDVTSPLGLAALHAQEPNWIPPRSDALLTAEEYLKHYLLPLAASDLLVDHLRTDCEVVAVDLFPNELLEMDADEAETKDDTSEEGDAAEELDEEGSQDADDDGTPATSHRFRIHFRDCLGAVGAATADAVLDCTGAAGLPGMNLPLGEMSPLFFRLSNSQDDSAAIRQTPAERLDPIRRAFAILGGREKLNLYATIRVR